MIRQRALCPLLPLFGGYRVTGPSGPPDRHILKLRRCSFQLHRCLRLLLLLLHGLHCFGEALDLLNQQVELLHADCRCQRRRSLRNWRRGWSRWILLRSGHGGRRSPDGCLSERHQFGIWSEKKKKMSKKMIGDSPIEYSFKNKDPAKTQPLPLAPILLV